MEELTMEIPRSMVLIIFGASGDLCKRKLMPALYFLYKEKRVPSVFAILGTARTSHSDRSFRQMMKEELSRSLHQNQLDEAVLSEFIECLYYQPMNPTREDDYFLLQNRLKEMDRELTNESNYLFYLAVPPTLYETIPKLLKKAGLTGEPGIKRIVVEKPFGYDLNSAQELNEIYTSVFREDEIFRIDHFLGKETVLNILALRFANSIFEPIWNRNYVDYIEITAVEKIGVERRAGFFEQTGTLRDMVQNHLMQLLALIAMEPPRQFNAISFRDEVSKIYRSLKPFKEGSIGEQVVRGQYTTAENVKGYREEESVAPDSRTETFVAMKVFVDNWRWSGIPFFLRTGKRMPTKVTEIIVHFKQAPYHLFECLGTHCPVADSLVIRIQPEEGIVLRFALKVPGSGFEVKMTDMDFSYASLGHLPAMEAYARLIEDCFSGDSTLFSRGDTVEDSWSFFTPVLEYWKNHPEAPLYSYPAGTWGPHEADKMMEDLGFSWSNPCKNLTNTDKYCEL